MFKKFLLFTLILGSLVGAGYLVYTNREDLFGKEIQAPVEEEKPEVSAFKDKLDPIYGDPVRLYIPKVNIDARILEVSTDETGVLEAPAMWNELGWYRKSAKTGQIGNVIIDGHYDDNHGRPASFWTLKNVEPDDKVYLVDSYGRVYTYKVSEVFYLGIADPNRLEVLEGEEGKASLTLITCGGVWNISRSTYDKRLVVKADRV